MPSRFSARTAAWTLILFALWLLLSESLNPLHIAVGAVAALTVSLLSGYSRSKRTYSVRWIRALAYFPWLFGHILMSGLRVAYLILHPKLPIKPKIFRYPTSLGNDVAVMLLGNSITLTPGTVTVEARSDELTVHAIDSDSAGDLDLQRLERAVAGVFRSGGKQA